MAADRRHPQRHPRHAQRDQHDLVAAADHPAHRRQLAVHGHRVRHARASRTVEPGHRRATGLPGRRPADPERHARPAADRRHVHRRARSSSPDAPRTRPTRTPASRRSQVAVVNAAGQYMSSTGTFTSTTAELPHGVPQQPGQRRVELLLHDAGHPGRDLHASIVQPVDVHNQIGVGADLDRHRRSRSRRTTRRWRASPTRCNQNVCTFDGRGSTDENADLADVHVELRHPGDTATRSAAHEDLHRSSPGHRSR